MRKFYFPSRGMLLPFLITLTISITALFLPEVSNGQCAIYNLILKPTTPLCSPSTVNLYDLIDPASTLPAEAIYRFTIGTSNVADPTKVSTGGTYIISAFDANGCGANAYAVITINETPVLNTTLPVPFCSNDNIAFALSPQSPDLTWNGPGVGIAGTNYVFRPLSAGPGNHTLTVINNTSGCRASETFIVQDAPVLFLKPAPLPVCSPATINLNDLIDPSSHFPAGTILRFFNGLNEVSDPSKINVTGTYTITAILNNSCLDRRNILVTVNQTPILSSVLPQPFCSNDNLTFFLNPQGSNLIWNGPGVGISGSSPVFRPLSAGPGNHTLTLTDNLSGCHASETFTVTDAPVLILKPAPLPVCSPATINLNDLIDPSSHFPTGTTIRFFNGLNEVSDPTKVTTTGTYTIFASVNNSCNDRKDIFVTVNQSPNLSIVGLDHAFCSSDNTVYTFPGSNSNIWTGPGIIAGNSYNPFVAGPGTHTLTATSAANGCQSTIPFVVIASPVLVLKPSAPVCSPQTVDLTKLIDLNASVLPPGTTFGYLFNGNQVSDPSAVTQSGTYTIGASISAANTPTLYCSSTVQSVTVTINQTPVITPLVGSFCSGTQELFPLISSTSAGWSGPGVVNSISFRPSSAGPGTHTLIATSLNGNCQATQQVKVYATPVLVLKGSAAVCSPQTVDLTKLIDMNASVLPPGTTFGYLLNGNQVSDPTAVTQSGVYTIGASVSAANTPTLYCSSTAQTVTVTINQTPLITPLVGPFCSNSQELFPLTSSPAASWNGPGVVNGNTWRPSSAGPGTHTLIATNSIGGCQASQVVTVTPTPLLVLKPSAPVCSPQTVDLTKLIDMNASVLPPGTTFSYGINGNLVSDPSAITQSGTYAIVASISTNTGTLQCSSFPQFVTVTINQTPVITPLVGPFCSNSQELFPLTSSPAASWNGPGVVNGNTWRPSSAGPGTHTLIATNSIGGCQASQVVTVTPTPLLVLKPSAPVCSPQTVDLTKLIDMNASVLPPGTTFSYGINGNLVSDPSAITQSGTYAIVASISTNTGTLQCSSFPQFVTVTINQTPLITPLVGPFCSNSQELFPLTSSPAASWNGPGVVNGNTWRPSSAGPGTHTLIATNSIGGCQASQTVTVLPPPNMTDCPQDIFVNNNAGQCGAIVNYNAPSLTAGCGNASISATGPASGSLFPIGITTITFTLKDASNNVLSSCSFKVTVIDNEKPVLLCQGDQNLLTDQDQCGATYATVPAATDNCSGLSVNGIRSDGKSLSDLYAIGSTTITWTATDASGNTSTCTQVINVTDKQKPVINCSGTVNKDADPGSCGAAIQVNTPIATDNCGTPVITSHRSDGLGPNSPYPIGTTTITWTATDASGNTATCTQDVIVTDNENPVINCSSNISSGTDQGMCTATILITAPAATDNCGTPVVSGTRSDGLPINSLFAKGVTSITWTAIDAHGNTSSCIQNVTVTDNEKPKITAPPSINVNAPTGTCTAAALVLGSPVTSDNCGVASITNNAPVNFPVGTTTIIWTVTDNSGNTNTAIQTVKVSDVDKPLITGAVQKIFCNGTATSYTIDPVVVSDNCGLPSVNYSVTGATVRSGTGVNASGSFATGTSVISWIATDASGNSSTWQTKVIVGNAIILSIPDAFSLTSGVAANTVYPAYASAASIKLKAVPTGGTGSYIYHWSNGATTQTITVSPIITTIYSVTVTDAAGCSSTQTKQVSVVDIKCGTGKVTICCKSGSPATWKPLCVTTGLVPYYLLLGAKLGPCTANLTSIEAATGREVSDEPAITSLTIKAIPNPSANGFNLEIRSTDITKKGRLIIYNGFGKIVEIKEVTPNTSVHLGDNYINGIYFAELIQGKEKATIKLLKIGD